VTASVVNTKLSASLWERIHAQIATIKSEAAASVDSKAVLKNTRFTSVTDTFKKLGVKKSSYVGSNESLYKRVLSDKDLYQINTVVDINNLVSLISKRSVGTYNMDNLSGELHLRPGAAGEVYTGTTKRDVTLDGITLLCDRSGPFGSPYSDSQRALIGEDTKNIAMVIYSFDGEEGLVEELATAASLLREYVSATNVKGFICSHGATKEVIVEEKKLML
jgi:DNA/RNA-binding domain of Phe-tRNA-synthetase-like protein